MALRKVCPVLVADPTVTGHGTDAGYSNGGWVSHAERCEAANADLAGHGVTIDLKTTGRRGIETEEDFYAAAAAKAAQSAPVEPAQAAENVVLIDGIAYRKA